LASALRSEVGLLLSKEGRGEGEGANHQSDAHNVAFSRDV
jgi:hypothetical protein